MQNLSYFLVDDSGSAFIYHIASFVDDLEFKGHLLALLRMRLMMTLIERLMHCTALEEAKIHS